MEKTSAGGDTTVLQSYYLRSLLDSYYFEQKLNTLIGFEGNFDNTEGARILGNSQQIGDLAGFINLKYNINSKVLRNILENFSSLKSFFLKIKKNK